MARRVYGGNSAVKPTESSVSQSVEEKPVTQKVEQESKDSDKKEIDDVNSSKVTSAPVRKAKRVYGAPSANTSVPPKNSKLNIIDDDEDDEIIEIPVRKKRQTKPKKKMSKKKKIVTTIIVSLFLITIGVLVFFAIKYAKEDAEIEEMWNGVREMACVDEGPASEEAYSQDPIDREIDWEELLAINDEIKCWVYIPGTNIDYPVLQEQTLNEYYYLHRDIYKNYSYMGSILTPKEPDGFDDKDAKFMLFGHHMIGKQMFGHLDKYKSEEFYREYPYVYIYYPDRTERWIVWSAYHTTSSDIIYDMPYEKGTDEYADLLKTIEKNRWYETAAGSVNNTMNILTLSTCDSRYSGGNGRFVVNCVNHKTKWLDKQAEMESIKREQEEEQKRQEEIRETNDGSYYDTYEFEFQGGE